MCARANMLRLCADVTGRRKRNRAWMNGKKYNLEQNRIYMKIS